MHTTGNAVHENRTEETLHEYENVYRRHESTLESQSPLGIGIDLEKQWSPIQTPSVSRSSTEPVTEPEKVQTKSREDDGAGASSLEETRTAQRVVTAQDWTGPDDPENPQNWPTWKKVYHAIPCAMFGFVV